ncbi:MAG: hypothetical protein ABL967_09270 [Bryobacteraceae bacterium]
MAPDSSAQKSSSKGTSSASNIQPPPLPVDPVELEAKKEKSFRERILKDYFVRFHMGLILTSVIATGVLGNVLLLRLGFRWMHFRYPIAVLLSYGAFLVLVRIWIWWVTGAKLAVDLSLPNVSSSGGGSPSGSSGGSSGSSSGGVKFGGGSSGGGGATDSWGGSGGGSSTSVQAFTGGPQPMPLAQMNQASLVNAQAATAESSPWSVRPGKSSGGASGSGFNLGGFDGDDLWILLLLALLVLTILFAGGYLIYVAPQMLPEAAWQAAMAGGLHRMAKRKPDWKLRVIRSSVIPFLIVLGFATMLGWEAKEVCPGASKLLEVLQCTESANPQ